MSQELTLFVGMFTTLLAIINPLEALPVYLELLGGKDEAEHQRVARLSCFYALLLAFFFLFFGHLILWIFGVPLSMVRIVGRYHSHAHRLRPVFTFVLGCIAEQCRKRLGRQSRRRRLRAPCHADHVWTGSHRDHPWHDFDGETLRICIRLRCCHLCCHCGYDVRHLSISSLRQDSSQPHRT